MAGAFARRYGTLGGPRKCARPLARLRRTRWSDRIRGGQSQFARWLGPMRSRGLDHVLHAPRLSRWLTRSLRTNWSVRRAMEPCVRPRPPAARAVKRVVMTSRSRRSSTAEEFGRGLSPDRLDRRDKPGDTSPYDRAKTSQNARRGRGTKSRAGGLNSSPSTPAWFFSGRFFRVPGGSQELLDGSIPALPHLPAGARKR